MEDQAKLIYQFLSGDGRLLIVLDALRLDVTYELAKPCRLEVRAVESRGRWTDEWLLKTFTRPLRGVVYVTANPRVRIHFRPGPFTAVVDLSRSAWSDELNTVPPWRVVEAASKVMEAGCRRLIAHFLQPHAPFLVDPRPVRELSAEEYRHCYCVNAAIALHYALKLAKRARSLGFRAAITSDHSELLGVYAPLKALRWLKRKHVLKWLKDWLPYALGARRVVGHPMNWPGDELREVPWIEV